MHMWVGLQNRSKGSFFSPPNGATLKMTRTLTRISQFRIITSTSPRVEKGRKRVANNYHRVK
jgi:hypothetical protein